MYKFSDLILDETQEMAVQKTAAKKPAPQEKHIAYTCDVAEPDIVFTKKTIKGDKETVNGQAVFLVTQKQFYVKTVTRGKTDEPVILTGENSDEFASKLSAFFNQLPKTGNDKMMATGCKWLPVIEGGKVNLVRLCKALLNKDILELIKKGYMEYTNTREIAYRFGIDDPENLFFILDEATKILGADAVRKTVTAFVYGQQADNSQLAALIGMCRVTKVNDADQNTIESTFSNELVKRYGISGLRDFTRMFLSVVNPYIFCYNRYIKAVPFDIFYSDLADSPERKFELKRLSEYLTYAPISQGYMSMIQFLNNWDDALRMQETLYGKVREKYPDYLASLHDLLSAKIDVMDQEINTEKFAAHARREKALNWAPEGSKYCIISPETQADMSDEASQQANCLSGYIKPFAEDSTDIYFMRLKKIPDKSLVTIEVNNGRVRQAFRARNEQITADESRFLAKWCEKFGIEYDEKQHFNALAAPAA